MRPRRFVYTLSAASLTGYASNATGASWPLTATTAGDGLAHPVTIKNDSATDHSGKTVVITGTDANGTAITETLNLGAGSATVTSTKYFKTVTSVVMTGTADADGIPVVTRLTQAGTTAILGAVVGVVPNPADLTLGYRKASTLMKVMVDTDPNTVYEIADSSSAQTTCIAATDVGNNATLSLGTVDTTTGNGKTVLGTTIGTTTTLNVKILGLSPKVGNAIGDYAKYLVLINNHQFRAGTAGI